MHMPSRTRAQRTAKQRAWRQTRAAHAITVHLDARDLATLDAIAIELYYEHPHDPDQDQRAPTVFPGRPQAIRALCAQWRKRNGQDVERELGPLQRELAQFYAREASWRRSRGGPLVRRPEPPWTGGVDILDRLLRPEIL